MSRRSYSGNAITTTLNGPITNTATSLVVVDATGYPTALTGPFVITVDLGLSTEEKILVGARTLTTLSSLTRGYDGTTAVAHSTGASVRHTISAVDVDEANAHINSAASHVGLLVTPVANNLTALVIKALASQTGDLLQVQGPTGTVLANIANNGGVSIGIGGNGVYPFQVISTLAPTVLARFQGSVAQSGDLTQWQDSSGGITAYINAAGGGNFRTLALTVQPVSSSATSGGASALPAAPLGYMQLALNGGTVKIPYYSV